MRHYPETALQASIISYWKLAGRRDCLLFSIPNEHECSAQAMARLKRLGLCAGIADLCLLFHAREGKPPHFIECKSARNSLSEAQQGFRIFCSDMGWPYEVARSLDRAILILQDWKATRQERNTGNEERPRIQSL